MTRASKKKFGTEEVAFNCPVAGAMKHLSGKWKFGIVWELHQHPDCRFAELRRKIPTITERVFIRALKELEGSGILSRKSYAEVPPRVTYRLTKTGNELVPIIVALSKWSRKYRFHESTSE